MLILFLLYHTQQDHHNDILPNSSKYSNERYKSVINRHKLEVNNYSSCWPNVSYTFAESTCDLSIFGSELMTEFPNANSIPWNSYASSINTAMIGDGVTSIGRYTFYFCQYLTSALKQLEALHLMIAENWLL